MNRVELLAPAGNYETLVGVINAGADAVYLAGNRFGARAYANNFSDEELIKALDYAHLNHVKIYLTLNTLIKEDEMKQIYDFVLPLYQSGLDGIIIQDIGVFQYIKKQFPTLPLHISTQVSAANHEAMIQLKELGAQRIVPARELMLSEIKSIRKETDIELETFIHGAICYSYSGQCLFSSILGGRSGNRGRCAQPCRLPYQYHHNEEYCLSMKDMCTVSMLPELIEAGISSFKIEGRMKSPEYAAGVTAIYRKYIDQYYKVGKINITDEDNSLLKNLYVRKDLCNGYYKTRNDKNLVTITEPCYQGNDSHILSIIADKYLSSEKKINIKCTITMKIGEKVTLSITDQVDENKIIVYGPVIEEAKNNPISSESIRKQLRKTGQTFFEFSDIVCNIEERCFCQIKDLNELRRNAIEEFQKQILKSYTRSNVPLIESSKEEETVKNNKIDKSNETDRHLSIEVLHEKQLKFILTFPNLNRVYLDYELFMQDEIEWNQYFKEQQIEWYISLPHILREDRLNTFDRIVKRISHYIEKLSGVLARDYGEIRIIKKSFPDLKIITDANLYQWNEEANKVFHNELCNETTLPYELNEKELCSLNVEEQEFIIYSHIPLMITANCIKKTNQDCNRISSILELEDRYHKKMPVQTYCTQCYNVIYNSIPYSLLSKKGKLNRVPATSYRIVLLNENESQILEIMNQWNNNNSINNQNQFTNGHFARGVQ